MSYLLTSWKLRDLSTIIIFLQLIVYATVFFDVPVARQVIGFLYFTFIPGFIIIKLLKLDEFDGLETILFSVGLSIIFLILLGLFINEIGLLLGFSRPLSLTPLMIILNSFILVGAFLIFLRKESSRLWNTRTLRLLHPLTIVLAGLPILSILGAMWVNAFGNNLILLFMLITISALFVIAVVSKRGVPQEFYPFVLFAIAISLLYHSSLISNYIVAFGSDVPVEQFVFQNTQKNAYWSSTNPYFGDIGFGRIHSMLSVTILPTVYSSLLNIDSTWIFKIVSPLIFSFVPLGLYQMWGRYIGKKYAFVSAFLFMAYATFYNEMLGLNRQMIAELFFVLLLLIVLNKKVKPSIKMMFFFLFSFGLVTSHYGLSEIFLFFVSLTFVILVLVKQPSINVTASMVVFFFATMFVWYIYTSGSATFNSLLDFGGYVYSQLDEFFNPAARGQMVLRGLGLESPPTIWNAVSRAFAYATQFLIIIGFFGLITKRIKFRLEREYFAFSCVAVVFLAALIVVPGLANTMNMTRFYHILLFFLAPLCVMGAEVFVKLVSKWREEFLVSILLLIVLVPYFLFQTSFIYEITGSESWSISLSGYRMGPKLYISFGFCTDHEVLGAKWLSQYAGSRGVSVYVDTYSRTSLVIYGMMPYSSMSRLSNATVVGENEFVYVGKLNTFYGKVFGVDVWNFTSVQSLVLSDLSTVYSNGICEIYAGTK